MSTGYCDFDLTLPCGLRITVQQLSEKGWSRDNNAHAFEHTWCVESLARIFGRGFDPNHNVALGQALECAKNILQECRTMLEHIDAGGDHAGDK